MSADNTTVRVTIFGEDYQIRTDLGEEYTKECAEYVDDAIQEAAALALGNSCVIKASEYSPYSLLRFVEILHEADIPPGLINLVNGRGHITGKSLVEHAGVDVIGFVGGTETGKASETDPPIESDDGIDWTVPDFPNEAAPPTGTPDARPRNPVVIDEPPPPGSAP